MHGRAAIESRRPSTEAGGVGWLNTVYFALTCASLQADSGSLEQACQCGIVNLGQLGGLMLFFLVARGPYPCSARVILSAELGTASGLRLVKWKFMRASG